MSLEAAGPPEVSPRVDRASGLILALLMLAAFALVGQRILAVASGPEPPGPGARAPAVRGMSPDGQPAPALGGQVVLLDFWATWCPPCVAALPGLEVVHNRYRNRGVVILGVNQEPGDEAAVRAFLRGRGLTFPQVVDAGDVARSYGVFSYPTSFLVGADGVIRKVFRGPVPEDRLISAIEATLAEGHP